ncbi:MAG: Smr/MutS family protein [Bacilli bacterium]|nr:Smr/MutS family protein [Bacilli bacterium]
MSLNEIVFISMYPKLDLHGYDRASARVAIMDFINDNIKLKNNIIVIIHGVGSGALREETSLALEKNKHVIDYKVYYYNSGCTVAELKL